MTRAVKFTSASKQIEFYSDFLPNLELNPITSQLARITNENAVANSMKNLCLTNFSERFYHPEIGTNLNTLEFDMDDALSIEKIKETVQETVKLGEPRATLLSVEVIADPDHNSIIVHISFSLVNVVGVFTTAFPVRIR
jgi:hypothetical protein